MLILHVVGFKDRILTANTLKNKEVEKRRTCDAKKDMGLHYLLKR